MFANSTKIYQFIARIFDERISSRYGNRNWLLRPCDFTPSDFFLVEIREAYNNLDWKTTDVRPP